MVYWLIEEFKGDVTCLGEEGGASEGSGLICEAGGRKGTMKCMVMCWNGCMYSGEELVPF